KIEGIGCESQDFCEAGAAPRSVHLNPKYPYRDAVELILRRANERLDGGRLLAVAHRVVHGRNKYFAPICIDAAILEDLRNYTPLAPLHQPFALEAIDIMLRTCPDLPQVACF